MNAIESLESWKSKHKSRFVRIDIDNGYGAHCWSIYLGGEIDLIVAETEFIGDGSPSAWPHYHEDKSGDRIKYYTCVADEDMEDWPGLEKVILLALEAWDILVEKK